MDIPARLVASRFLTAASRVRIDNPEWIKSARTGRRDFCIIALPARAEGDGGLAPDRKAHSESNFAHLTALGFGTAPIGNQFRFVPEEDARGVIKAAWDAGLRYFDTAPMYGHGLSEHRLGEALRWYPRDEYVLSTKVGRILKPVPRSEVKSAYWVDPPPFDIVHDYTYDAVMRSFEDSLQRMALERFDILFIHDIDVFTHGPELQKTHFRTAMDSGFKALEKLRAEELVAAIGVGCNEWQVCEAALRERDFDCFLLAGRYTLLEQDALDTFLPLCAARNVGVVLGGGFNSGILATGAVKGAQSNYRGRDGAGSRPGPEDRSGLQPARCAAEGRGDPVRAGAPCDPDKHPRDPHKPAPSGKSQDGRSSDPRRLLAGAEGGRAASRGCPSPVLIRRLCCRRSLRSSCLATGRTASRRRRRPARTQ